ncbi:MAG: polyprenyl synthetase family protein [Acidimicrobiales bacterium]
MDRRVPTGNLLLIAGDDTREEPMGLAETTTTTPLAGRDAVPASIAAVAARIEQRFRALLGAERLQWHPVDHSLADPLDVLEDAVLNGGKRLRPTFVSWGYAATGADPDTDPGASLVDDAGLAFELLHAFALLHDDVMDGSDTRRGRTTPHVDWAGRHALEGWRGESRRFGEGVAILVGDLAHVHADALMGSAPAPPWPCGATCGSSSCSASTSTSSARHGATPAASRLASSPA